MEKPTKSQQGHAYVVVLLATVLVFATVVLLLRVTAVSRDTTSLYGVGMYPMAVASHEHVLALLNSAPPLDPTFYPPGLAGQKQQALEKIQTHFISSYFANHFIWDWQKAIHYQMGASPNTPPSPITQSGVYFEDIYTGRTTLYMTPTGFRLSTTVYKVTNGRPLLPVTVTSNLIWVNKYLDYYTLKMVELGRVIN